MPCVSRSQKIWVWPFFSSMRLGICRFSFGMSAMTRLGMVARASSVSGADWAFFRSWQIAHISLRSSSEHCFWYSARCCLSSSSLRAASFVSGVRMTVTREGLSRKSSLMAFSNTFSPAASLFLMSLRGFSQASGAMGSPSYSQVDRACSMATRPRGKRPEFASLYENSTVLTAASTSSAAMPFSARSFRVEKMSSSAFSTSFSSMPLRPVE